MHIPLVFISLIAILELKSERPLRSRLLSSLLIGLIGGGLNVYTTRLIFPETKSY